MKDKINLSFGIIVLCGFLLIGILNPFIANEQPLFCSCNGTWHFPVMSQIFGSSEKQESIDISHCSKVLYPLVRYSAGTIDRSLNKAIGPSLAGNINNPTSRHYLGTDNLGRDVAAGMISGTKTALTVSFITVLISLIFGSFTGMMAGFYGDKGVRICWIVFIISIIPTFLLCYFMGLELLVFSNQFLAFFLILIVIISCFLWTNIYLSSKLPSAKGFYLPVDMILLKLIELRKSIPAIFLILAGLNLFRYGSVWNIITIAVVLGWIEFARFARAETMNISGAYFVTGARVLGFSDFRIMFRYILPNILPVLIVVSCFSAAGVILLESTLSFLGIGLAAEDVSWGKMLAQGRDMKSWWLVIFPGTAIFLLILSLNLVADEWRKSMNH